ncbi:unnamed protein product, partial [Adineta ricciae]
DGRGRAGPVYLVGRYGKQPVYRTSNAVASCPCICSLHGQCSARECLQRCRFQQKHPPSPVPTQPTSMMHKPA